MKPHVSVGQCECQSAQSHLDSTFEKGELLPGSPLPGGLAEMKLNPTAQAPPTAGSRVPHLVPTVLVSYRQPLHTGAS